MFPTNHRRRSGLHEKTRFRIELAIRLQLTNLGITDTQIAKHLGMTSCSLSRLKNTTLYQQLHSQMSTGILSAADKDIFQNYGHLRKKLELGVPVALENLLSAATQRLDKKLQMEASKEILDRHGMFSKVSRIGLPTQEQGGVASEKDNELAHELLKAVTKQKNGTTITQTDPPPVTIDDAPLSEKVV